MVTKTVMRAVFIAALLVSVSGGLFAGDDAERDRKARVALALAGKKDVTCDRDARVARAISETKTKPIATAPATAPMPKKVSPCPCCDGCPCGGSCGCGNASKAIAKGDDLTRVRNALVRVRQGSAQGSGTVIWSESGRSVVLTAKHVVEDPGELTVRGNGKTYPATLLGRDESADLAALLVEADLPAVPVAAADPLDGAEVMMVGMTSLWSKGRIDRREQWQGGETYLLGGGYESDSGDSGGGVFAGGELVGVHCGKVGADKYSVRTPYAMGAKPIRSFLARVFKRNGTQTVPAAIAGTPATSRPTAPTAAPPVYAFPSYPSGGCANGQCPAPTYYPPRRGIFR